MSDPDESVRTLTRQWLTSGPAFGSLRTDAVAELVPRLESDDTEVVFRAAELLGALGAAEGADALAHCQRHGGPAVREASMWALAGLNDKRSLESLVSTLRRGDDDDRAAAAKALGGLRDSRALKPLVGALKSDRHEWVRWAAAHALAMLGDPEAVAPLCEALKRRSPGMRIHAAEALGDLGDPRAVPALAEALEDDYSEWDDVIAAARFPVSDHARGALKRIGGPDASAVLRSEKPKR